MRRFITPLNLLFLLLLASPGFAQMGRMQYPFHSRSQVIPVLKQTRGDLRKTYNALICAARLGYINTAIGYYESLMANQEFDADLADSAAYAFAFDLGTSVRPWDWKHDLDRGGIKASSRAGALLFRDRAFNMGSNTPEVLVMRSFWQASQGRPEFSQKAYATAQQAVKLAPDWADAHYWLAWAASHYALSYGDHVHAAVGKTSNTATLARLGRVELRAYDTAEKLDPALRPYFYLPRVSAYQRIADKKSAAMIPRYLDAHLRAFPNYMAWYSPRSGQNEAQLRASFREIARTIMNGSKN